MVYIWVLGSLAARVTGVRFPKDHAQVASISKMLGRYPACEKFSQKEIWQKLSH